MGGWLIVAFTLLPNQVLDLCLKLLRCEAHVTPFVLICILFLLCSKPFTLVIMFNSSRSLCDFIAQRHARRQTKKRKAFYGQEFLVPLPLTTVWPSSALVDEQFIYETVIPSGVYPIILPGFFQFVMAILKNSPLVFVSSNVVCCLAALFIRVFLLFSLTLDTITLLGKQPIVFEPTEVDMHVLNVFSLSLSLLLFLAFPASLLSHVLLLFFPYRSCRMTTKRRTLSGLILASWTCCCRHFSALFCPPSILAAAEYEAMHSVHVCLRLAYDSTVVR